jgi:hypothetical protein
VVNGWKGQVIYDILKALLKAWICIPLRYIGKVNVLKTLALSILVQFFTGLPNPPDSVLNDIEEIFYNFLWNGVLLKPKYYHLFYQRF